MDFRLTEEHEGLQRLARQIVQEELMPLEPRLLEEGRDDLWRRVHRDEQPRHDDGYPASRLRRSRSSTEMVAN